MRYFCQVKRFTFIGDDERWSCGSLSEKDVWQQKKGRKRHRSLPPSRMSHAEQRCRAPRFPMSSMKMEHVIGMSVKKPVRKCCKRCRSCIFTQMLLRVR